MPAHAPTKLTPERHEEIVEILSRGNFVSVACRAAGISRDTYYKWRERGQKALDASDNLDVRASDPEWIYALFVKDTDAALVGAEDRIVAQLQNAAEGGDVKAQIEFLKRRWRTRWGDSEHVTQETQVHVKSVKITDEKGKTVDPFGPAAGEGKDA